MTFGLEQHIIDKIITVFEANAKVDKAFVFGSRAKGNYRPDSDIDIAIKGIDITLDDILKMSVAFEDKGIKNKIDLLDYRTIKEPALQEHIDRVGIEFYSRWKEYKIADIISLEYGRSLLDYRNGTGKYDVFGTNGKIGTSNEFLYDKPSLIIGRKGAYREVHLSKKPFFVIDTAFYTKNKLTDLNTLFLYFWFKNIDINEMDSGSAIPSTSRDEVYDLDIKLPPLSEQTAIASILSSFDDKIDLLQRQNKTLEQLAETFFRQWFVEEAEEIWEEKSLPEIADYLNGLALQNFPAKIDSLPVIKIREMKQGISENTDKCSREIPTQYVIQDGDVLFSWSGSLEVVLWTGGEGALNQHLFKVTSKVYPKWFYYLATKHHLNDFKTIAESKSTTMGHIQREHLNQAMISIPPKEMFKQYDERIAPLVDKQIENQNQIRTLTQTRDTLLPKLMSGEVRVNI
jgi:type I restriction enzyme, S subunit